MRPGACTAAIVGVLALSPALPTATRPVDETVSDAFREAIRLNDLAKLGSLLEHGSDPNTRSERGITPLMDAAALGSTAAMTRLIAAGANVNTRNTLGSTALMWSVRELPKVHLLLDHGADVNIASNLGRTALLVAAMSDQSAEVVRMLIAKGADVRVIDRIGVTALHAAASGNDTDTVGILLDARLDVNARDANHFTPLMNASANGNTAVVKALLARGARVNDVSGRGDVKTHTAGQVKNGLVALGGFTALHLAVATAPPELVKTLLDAGADVNAKEIRGMTPLMMAVATDHANLEIVRLLLSRHGDLSARSPEGETALDWAFKFGSTAVVTALKRAGAAGGRTAPAHVPAADPVDVQQALTRTLALLGRTSADFFTKGGCAACHAQNVMDVAAGSARGKGFHLSEQDAASRLTATKARYVSSVPHLLERQDLPGSPDQPAYAMLALASAGYPADRMTDAIAVNIAAQQGRDGGWHSGGVTRPPIEDGDIPRTALATRALAAYAPPGRADIKAQIERARTWLNAAVALTGEDRSLRLLGLKWADADRAAIARAADDLLDQQRSDGGWAQTATLPSDAYATGQALFALATAGDVTPTSPAYARGVKYLLTSQRADGSWYVASRSPKFQPYFESGFPYGPDQWISAMAAGWAASALALALPPPQMANDLSRRSAAGAKADPRW